MGVAIIEVGVVITEVVCVLLSSLAQQSCPGDLGGD